MDKFEQMSGSGNEITDWSDYTVLDDNEGDADLESGNGDIEIIDIERHEQFPALVATIFDLKDRLDRFIELYGDGISTDDALKIITEMARFIDELEPGEDEAYFWVDYSKANAAISKIEREVPGLETRPVNEVLEKKRFFKFKHEGKFSIPGLTYVLRQDNHGSTPEDKGWHFALEDKDGNEMGVVITLDEIGIVHLEPHGDKVRGVRCIDGLFASNKIEELQILNDFTKYKFGAKPNEKRRRASKNDVVIDADLPARYYFEKGN